MTHRRVKAFVTPALLSLLVTCAMSVAAPQSISGLATATSLSEAEVAQIESHAQLWTQRLYDATADPAEVKDIRQELLEPITRGGVTALFRDQYSRASLPALERVVRDGNAHTSVVALVVISALGTEKALESLTERVSPRDEPRRHVRLAAARGCTIIFSGEQLEDAMPKKITRATRSLSSAAKQEPDALTLRHQAGAIFAAGQMNKLPDPSRAQIRGHLVETLQDVAERAMKAPMNEDPVGMLTAIYPLLAQIRNDFLKLPAVSQRDYGRQLGPCLQKLLDVATAHWTELQKKQSTDGQPGKVIYLCERFLAVVDGLVRGGAAPNTNLKQAWDSGDIARYKRDLKQWSTVLSSPPY